MSEQNEINNVSQQQQQQNYENCSNPNLTDSNPNEDEEEKLKGDRIGNTMYSERFVLKTLIKLKDNRWNDELESDMCTIWDMATERDVVDFLYKNNFFDITVTVLDKSKQLRLREILIGIVGNMLTFPKYPQYLMDGDAIHSILSDDSNDSLVLIQIMRVYKAVFHCAQIKHDLLLTDHQLELVDYILQSSRNHELLLLTLQVAAEMIAKLPEKNKAFRFLDNINEALNEICKNYYDNLLSAEFHKSICAYCKVLENLCTALSRILDVDRNKFKQVIAAKHGSIKATMKNIEFVLGTISDLDFVQIENDSFEYYIYCFANFLVTFNTCYNEKLVLHFCNIFSTIIENNLSYEGSVYDSISSFIMYSFCCTDTNVLKNTFKNWDKTRLSNLFIKNIINVDKQECSEHFIRKVESLCT